MDANNQIQISALARAKRLTAAVKQANDDLKRKSDELAQQAERDVADLEKLEEDLKQEEIAAINKMDTAVFEFLSDEEERNQNNQ